MTCLGTTPFRYALSYFGNFLIARYLEKKVDVILSYGQFWKRWSNFVECLVKIKVSERILSTLDDEYNSPFSEGRWDQTL